jgi:hypothetical protein
LIPFPFGFPVSRSLAGGEALAAALFPLVAPAGSEQMLRRRLENPRPLVYAFSDARFSFRRMSGKNPSRAGGG